MDSNEILNELIKNIKDLTNEFNSMKEKLNSSKSYIPINEENVNISEKYKYIKDSNFSYFKSMQKDFNNNLDERRDKNGNLINDIGFEPFNKNNYLFFAKAYDDSF